MTAGKIIFLFMLVGCATSTQWIHFNGVPTHRASTPVSTFYIDQIPSRALASYHNAIAYINAEIGCRLLEAPGVPTLNAIELRCWHERGGLSTNSMKGQTITHAVVQIPCAGSDVIAVHELLHALGLAHDDDLGSIMYPYVVGSGLHIRENDKASLFRRYCHD